MNKFQLLASASLMTFIVGPNAAAQTPEVAGSAIVAIPSIQAALGEQAPRSIAIGNELFRDELITTGPDGHLHILFRDESNMEMVNLPFWKDTDGGAALHLLALFNPRGNSSWRTDDKSFSQFVRVDYRAFIDLGKGTPDAFQGVNLR